MLTFSAKSISRRETFSHENVQVSTITHCDTLRNLPNGGWVIPANADYSLKLTLNNAGSSSTKTTSSDYELTIPSTFIITQSGWNEITDGITAKVSGDNTVFDSGYKLTVSATTDGTLTAEGITDTISYTLKSRDAATEAITAWEFTADELNASKDNVITGTTKTLGVDVEDYSTKTNGDYTDTITFTAEVQAAVTLLSLTVQDKVTPGGDNITFYYVEGETWRQAVNNHPTENTGWYILQDKYIAYSTLGTLADENSTMVGLPTSNTTIDTVIDSTKTWQIE